MYLWVRQYPVTDAMEEAEVDRRTAINGCGKYALPSWSSPIILGGPGVDESLFRHKPKVWLRANGLINSIYKQIICKNCLYADNT